VVFDEERLISTIRGTGGSEMKRDFCLVLSSFGAGKTASKFHNSLKNSRDRFDSWLTNVRVGWRDELGTPATFSHSAQRDGLIIQQDKSIEDTVREQLIAARLGQGTFRKNCLMLYPACPVTGTTFAPLLRASHIKPWAACANGNERLDPHNGIILAAHIDILFDQGWISFENDGYLLISNELDIGVKEQLLLPEKIKAFSVESYCYLEWHREHLLR